MLLRHLARPMLASWFVYDGVQAAWRPHEHAAAARRGADLVGERGGLDTPLSENQVTGLIRAHGIATVVAGTCLALGKAPRTSAFALAALTVPLAVVNEPFTKGGDRPERTRRFVGNVGAIGAALIAGADLEGRPGVQWRVKKVRRDLETAKKAKNAVKDAEHAASTLAATVTGRGRRARRRAAAAAQDVVGAA